MKLTMFQITFTVKSLLPSIFLRKYALEHPSNFGGGEGISIEFNNALDDGIESYWKRVLDKSNHHIEDTRIIKGLSQLDMVIDSMYNTKRKLCVIKPSDIKVVLECVRNGKHSTIFSKNDSQLFTYKVGELACTCSRQRWTWGWRLYSDIAGILKLDACLQKEPSKYKIPYVT